MSQSNICPRCHTPLPGDAPGGFCPRCTLLGALASTPARPLTGPDAAPQPPAASSPGIRAFGDYELLQEIARGGMGVIYKARQVSLNRLVAVKMILAGPLASRLAVERFHQEARAVANLQHPHIVALHEVGEHEGQHYFSMDLVDGPNLAQLVRQQPLPAVRAARYVQQVAEAVQFAHDHGILHRDLKPSNVLIDSLDQPRVTDFGLAKSRAGEPELTLSGQTLGSPNYLPPEQAGLRKGNVGAWSDVYSLGAMLYYLLTGRPPFLAETLEATLLQVLNQGPVSPRLLNPSVPRDLETVCRKCLEKETGRRYQTARELADELKRFLAGEPIRARPLGPWEKGWRWCRRNPAVASLTGALGLVCMVGLVAVVRQWQRAEQHARVAESATQAARQDLWQSLLNEARANRMSGQMGRKPAGLAAIAGAARIKPSVELRSEAIAHLALSDFEQAGPGRALTDETGIAFAPDLERYALISRSRLVTVHRASDHRELIRWQGGRGGQSLGFSPDGQWLRIGDGEALTVLNAGSAKVLFELRNTGCAVFSPDSRQLAVVHPDRTVRFYDLEQGREQSSPIRPRGRARRLAFHPRGDFLALATDAGVEIWDWRQPRLIESPAGPADVTEIACHEHFLAWGTGRGEIQTLDLRHRQTRRLQAHQDIVSRLLFDPPGELLVSTSYDTTCRFWDPYTGQQRLHTLRGTACGFNREGSQLAYSQQFGLGWWRRASPTGFRELHCDDAGDHRSWVALEQVDFSPNGRLLAVGKPSGVSVFDSTTGENRLEPPLAAGRFAFFDASGTELVVVNNDLVLHHALVSTNDAGRIVLSLGPHRRTPLPAVGPIFSAALSHDRRTLVLTTESEAVLVNLAERDASPVRFRGAALPKHAAISPDGRWLATGSFHGEGTWVWDATNGQRLTLLHRGNTATEFSPDGRLLVSADLRECRLYETATWQLRQTLPLASASDLPGVVSFSPDSRLLAMARDRYTFDLIDPQSAARIATFHSPNPQILLDFAFSPDGSVLAVGTGANQVQVWNLRELRAELAKLGLDW